MNLFFGFGDFQPCSLAKFRRKTMPIVYQNFQQYLCKITPQLRAPAYCSQAKVSDG
jgi:hypothetical protein